MFLPKGKKLWKAELCKHPDVNGDDTGRWEREMLLSLIGKAQAGVLGLVGHP
jgi:hypothetical protein